MTFASTLDRAWERRRELRRCPTCNKLGLPAGAKGDARSACCWAELEVKAAPVITTSPTPADKAFWVDERIGVRGQMFMGVVPAPKSACPACDQAMIFLPLSMTFECTLCNVSVTYDLGVAEAWANGSRACGVGCGRPAWPDRPCGECLKYLKERGFRVRNGLSFAAGGAKP